MKNYSAHDANHSSIAQLPERKGANGSTVSGVKEAISNAKEKVKDNAAEMVDKARTQMEEGANWCVDEASSHVRSLGETTRDVARTTRSPETRYVSRAFDWLAVKIEHTAEYFETRDVRDISNDAREIVRKHPGMVLGGLTLAGFAAARFLRASEKGPENPEENIDSPELDDEDPLVY